MRTLPNITILLITSNRLVRADYGSDDKVPATIWNGSRGPGCGIQESVRTALALGGKTRSKVWVLCEDLWTQSITLARSQIAGLSEDQIAKALTFEVEPFSGIPSNDCVLGFSVIKGSDGKNIYWVVESSQSDLDAIQRSIRESGGRLAGMCHPSGLPVRIGDTPHGTMWQRVELWARGIVWIRRDKDQSMHVQSITPAQLLDKRFPSTEYSELLNCGNTSTVAGAAEHVTWLRFALDDDNTLHRWLNAWAECLRSASRQVSVILPPQPVALIGKHVLVGAMVEIAIVVLCLLHWQWMGHQKTLLRKKLAEFNQPTHGISLLTTQNATLLKDLTDIRQTTKEWNTLSMQRHALSMLLRSLATECPNDIVIQRVDVDSARNLIIQGVSLEASSADEFTACLSKKLRQYGWMVQPRQKKAKRVLNNGGPWEFMFNVLRVIPSTDDLTLSPPYGNKS